ncbi:hypothetical protein E1293_34600 [Actinomadura darangshiensis]|uniref:Uncharacterized protein n=1 Tax=Actinomadura darangshiensis TaxID=705336 RepID=A0A4R5ADM4_9ACTN|nr:hypothetical protein [Actinomadura darangshiensis]TDD70588.1 hypothetical protein E1293_34600 [Actinomadura darangshiensis]
MRVTITVPEETTAGFVVATERDPGDLVAAIRRRLPGPFAAAVSGRLGTPRLTLTCHPAAGSPWDLDDVPGLDEDDAARIRQARRHIGVTSVLPAGDLPSGPHLARAAAKAIAEALCGIPVDLASGEVVPVVPFGRFDEFTLADDWLGLTLPPYRRAGHCNADEDDIDGCACVDLRTRGLHRFGLPELEITGVACPHDLAALNVLRTTAQRLLPLGRHPGDHALPAELMLTSADFSAFWGNRDPVWDDGPVAVRLTEVAPGRLGISAPDGFPGTLNEWLWDELPPVLHDLLSCEPDRVVPNHPGG